jgi:transposase
MDNVSMTGCDSHDKDLVLKTAVNKAKARGQSFENNESGRVAMTRYLKGHARENNCRRIVFAYEASGQGYGLYDQLREAGIECHVLAPTKMEKSLKRKKQKNDKKDAEDILKLVRGHVLAGNDLPTVWVPDHKTRDDREVVRVRLDARVKATAIKAQMVSLLKRHQLRKPKEVGSNWTKGHRGWLDGLVTTRGAMLPGARGALSSLLRQLESLECEVKELDEEVEALSEEHRYAEPARELGLEKGVGLLTAMVYLSEMGDLRRFKNRRQIGCYLGLVPSSDESGERSEKKGHITHQGPERVRKVLCQAVWARIRSHEKTRLAYEKIVAKNPKHKKIAVVAMMRRLGILLWHVGLRAQLRAEVYSGPVETAA